MKTTIIYLSVPFITALILLFSCANPSKYGSATSTNSSTTGQSTTGQSPITGFTPATTGTSETPAASQTPSGATPASCTQSDSSGEYGGVTCASGNNRDQHFRRFLTTGTLITGQEENLGDLGNIDCTPSNTGGVLFKMSVVVLGKNFNPAGNNPQLSISTGSSSTVNFHIIHKPATDFQRRKFGEQGVITFQLNAVSGSINGNRAILTFSDEKGSVVFDGRFDNTGWFQGSVNYQNTVNETANTQSYSGALGNFRIPTCKVFLLKP